MGKENYLGNRILQKGSGNKRNTYGNGYDPYSQYGGNRTRKTKKRQPSNLELLAQVAQRAGDNVGVGGVEGAVLVLLGCKLPRDNVEEE